MVKTTDWQKFWMIPCLGVVVSLALFLLLFSPPAKKADDGGRASTARRAVETALSRPSR